jgi:hypothetical protein
VLVLWCCCVCADGKLCRVIVVRVSGCIVCLDSGDFGYWCLVFRGVIITLYYYLFSLPNHYLFRFALLSYLYVDL